MGNRKLMIIALLALAVQGCASTYRMNVEDGFEMERTLSENLTIKTDCNLNKCRTRMKLIIDQEKSRFF